MEIIENRLATNGEDGNHEERSTNGEVRGLVSLFHREILSNRQKDGRVSWWVKNDQHRDNNFTKKIHVAMLVVEVTTKGVHLLPQSSNVVQL